VALATTWDLVANRYATLRERPRPAARVKLGKFTTERLGAGAT
jgi:hypothetical protein